VRIIIGANLTNPHRARADTLATTTLSTKSKLGLGSTTSAAQLMSPLVKAQITHLPVSTKDGEARGKPESN